MGTNYYSVTKRYRDLERDGDLRYETLGTQEKLHIGKSSAGWHFGLHVFPETGIHDIEGWVPYLLCSDRVIVDEYGEELTYEKLINVITQRGREEPCNWSDDMLYRNFAERVWLRQSRSRHLGLHYWELLLMLFFQTVFVFLCTFYPITSR